MSVDRGKVQKSEQVIISTRKKIKVHILLH